MKNLAGEAEEAGEASPLEIGLSKRLPAFSKQKKVFCQQIQIFVIACLQSDFEVSR